LRRDNEQIDSRRALEPDDVVQTRVIPPVRDPTALARARSDAGVAPRASYLQFPDLCRPLRAVARSVVGEEQSPWLRARRLAAWLEGEDFTYTLQMPEVDTQRPVVDFVLRRRRGHCEYFAAALTLMLRALGHPARIVKGFRGGDPQYRRQTWIVRGSNYHAWTELYLEGFGWIPLDATPPDRLAVDAESRTRAGDDPGDGGGASVGWFVLRYGPREREALGRALHDVVEGLLLRPLAWLFGPKGRYVGVPLLLLLALLLLRILRRKRRARRVGMARRRDLDGPYATALDLLARRGLARRRTWTPREYLAVVGRRVPDARPHLGLLTHQYEEERYGQRRPDAAARHAARISVEHLREALGRRRATTKESGGARARTS
ncbi:MAG: DUF4129 domain-containing transglutaminase family protein, partial [Planctomycetota bacterium]